MKIVGRLFMAAAVSLTILISYIPRAGAIESATVMSIGQTLVSLSNFIRSTRSGANPTATFVEQNRTMLMELHKRFATVGGAIGQMLRKMDELPGKTKREIFSASEFEDLKTLQSIIRNIENDIQNTIRNKQPAVNPEARLLGLQNVVNKIMNTRVVPAPRPCRPKGNHASLQSLILAHYYEEYLLSQLNKKNTIEIDTYLNRYLRHFDKMMESLECEYLYRQKNLTDYKKIMDVIEEWITYAREDAQHAFWNWAAAPRSHRKMGAYRLTFISKQLKGDFIDKNGDFIDGKKIKLNIRIGGKIEEIDLKMKGEKYRKKIEDIAVYSCYMYSMLRFLQEKHSKKYSKRISKYIETVKIFCEQDKTIGSPEPFGPFCRGVLSEKDSKNFYVSCYKKLFTEVAKLVRIMRRVCKNRDISCSYWAHWYSGMDE